MPKLSKALAEARRIFASAASEYMDVLSSLKESVSPTERKTLREKATAKSGLPTTKSGRPSLPKEIRNDPAKVIEAAEQVRSAAPTQADIYGATLKDAAYYLLAVKPRRIRKINRMLDELKKTFGATSTQYKEALAEVSSVDGIILTKSGNISQAKSKIEEGDIDKIENAYYKTPRAKHLWQEAWDELFEESPLSKKDKKELQQSHWKSPTLRQAVSRYAVVSHLSEDDYGEVLKRFYEMEPSDVTSEAAADYDDILHTLGHAGHQLSYGEIEANINAITNYLRDSLMP